MISSLRNERDIEREAHQKTRDEAECRITALQAQVACREAQLESYVDYLKSPEPGPGHSIIYRKPTIRDEILKILDTTTTRNKELEAEIKILLERVSPLPCHSLHHLIKDTIQLNHARRRAESHPSGTRHVSTSDVGHRTTNHHSDHQHGEDKAVSRTMETSHPLLHPKNQPLSLTPTPIARSPSRKGQHPLLVNSGGFRDSVHIAGDHLSASLNHNLPKAIQDLDNQISDLATKIDDFRTERITLVEMLARQAQSESVRSKNTIFWNQ